MTSKGWVPSQRKTWLTLTRESGWHLRHFSFTLRRSSVVFSTEHSSCFPFSCTRIPFCPMKYHDPSWSWREKKRGMLTIVYSHYFLSLTDVFRPEGLDSNQKEYAIKKRDELLFNFKFYGFYDVNSMKKLNVPLDINSNLCKWQFPNMEIDLLSENKCIWQHDCLFISHYQELFRYATSVVVQLLTCIQDTGRIWLLIYARGEYSILNGFKMNNFSFKLKIWMKEKLQ